MTANQIFRGVRWPHAASRIGFIGACLALTSACGGSIEETDVDRGHLEQGNTGVPQKAAPTAAATPPVATTPRVTTPAATPPASTPAAPVNTAPAATPDPVEPEPEEPVIADKVSFASDVYPIFTASCGPCHTAGNSGGQSIGSADKAAALADAKTFKDAIVRDISSGDMPLACAAKPPGGAGCVTKDDFETIQAWVEGGTLP